jgi:hypothetical protein
MRIYATGRDGNRRMWLHNCKVPCNYLVCMQADIKILFSVYDYAIRDSSIINVTELWISFMSNYLGANQRTPIRQTASPHWSWKLKAPEYTRAFQLFQEALSIRIPRDFWNPLKGLKHKRHKGFQFFHRLEPPEETRTVVTSPKAQTNRRNITPK